MTGLKSCPFCGSAGELWHGPFGECKVSCSNQHCGAGLAPDCWQGTDEQAEAAWNRRSGWQPIETTEPENGKSYWVAYQFGQGEAWYIDGEWYLRETMSEPPGVTHWMPLPEPPQ